MKIQVCFQVKDKEHNDYVIEKLKQLRNCMDEEDNDKIISCHLPKHVVQEKGWDTSIVDAFEEIFGSSYESIYTGETFEEMIENVDASRERAAEMADRIVIIGEQNISNIALEIELFTNNRVMFI